MDNGVLRLRAGVLALFLFLTTTSVVHATNFRRMPNFVDLVGQSDLIVHGTVKSVSDGIDARGLPYTEVTVHVSETLKGHSGQDYTFRQFGLIKPRKMGNGMTMLMVTPAGFATYKKGEDTILFLYKPAARTGLRTTAGLGQGKFVISVGNAMSQFNNEGLFDRISVDQSGMTDAQKRVMTTRKGAVNAQGFVSLIRSAVNEKWVENGRMKNVQK